MFARLSLGSSFWMEKFLPFGLRTSPFLFDLFSKGVNWIVIHNGHDCIHYLDDFLCIEDSIAKALLFGAFFDDLCKELGINVNVKKNQCDTTVDFLGIELDTMLMEARLPKDKLNKASDLVKSPCKKHLFAKMIWIIF